MTEVGCPDCGSVMCGRCGRSWVEEGSPARVQSNERVAGGSVAHLEAEEQRALVEAQRALVEALLEAVTERQAGVTVEDFGRGYEIGLAYAAIVIGVEEAAFPQRETQLPAWLAAHPEGSD